MRCSARRVSRGCRAPPPPLEIEKQKKKSSERVQLFHLYFATFLVGNIIFFSYFLSSAPPLKNNKAKKKPFRFLPPPPYGFLDTPLSASQMFVDNGLMNFEGLIRNLTNTFINRLTASGNGIVRALLDNMVARDSMWKYWYNTYKLY